jgi:tetratricopeptide (TPR) repeat protein
MHCLGRVLTLIAVLWLWPASAVGQSAALMDAYNRSRELNTEGRYEQAIPFAEKALRLGKQEFGPKNQNTGHPLNNLALLYSDQGRYADAEPL